MGEQHEHERGAQTIDIVHYVTIWTKIYIFTSKVDYWTNTSY